MQLAVELRPSPPVLSTLQGPKSLIPCGSEGAYRVAGTPVRKQVITGLPSSRQEGPYLPRSLTVDFGGFLGQQTLEGRPRDTQAPCGFPGGQSGHCSEPGGVDPTSGSAEPDTLRLGPRQSRLDPLLNPGPLEFGVMRCLA